MTFARQGIGAVVASWSRFCRGGRAWIYPEHRDIADRRHRQAVTRDRAALDRLWAGARRRDPWPAVRILDAGDQEPAGCIGLRR